MNNAQQSVSRSPGEVAEAASELKRRGEWEPLAALAEELPRHWPREWLPVADEVAFALSQLGRSEEARDLLLRAYEIEPQHRRASALAYVHYDALLRHKVRKPRLDDAEPYRKEFERWIAEALHLKPESLVDRYRLGVYHASIQTCKDTVALKAFRDVLRLFERLPATARTPQSRHWKTYIRALYGAARSAYRLGRLDEARRWIFRCIRLDRERHHVRPVFKLFLAAKVLLAQGDLANAERALRLAIDAPHQGDRDFVYALLAEVALRQDRVEDAVAWVDLNIRPHHRKPYVWRLLGDCEARRNHIDRALKFYKSALLKDRGGRHKTLLCVARLAEQAGDLDAARRAYEQAADFRRRRYLTEDAEALEGLARLHERQGDVEAARAAYARMARVPTLTERAERGLARLAG
jgi:tetratricopeptide (TPR) repeat protein